MKGDKKYFLIAASIFLLYSLSVDLRNFLENGDVFVVNGDIFDSINFYLSIPGVILSFIPVLIVYQNIHNYDFYFMWSFALIFNGIFYGTVFYFLYPFIKKYLKNSKT